MALLSVAKRKEYFKALGFGEYNKDSILKFQKKYFIRKKDMDGIYGNNTDILLRHVWNVSKTKNFSPKEFICDCGGKYCTGYPTYMKDYQLANLQAIRNHWNRPMTITSGLRCRTRNARVGGIRNSLHLFGEATDFYMVGVTDTLAHRKSAIKWIKKLKRHHYTYGNGCNSAGGRPYAPYMGNALHTDSQ